MVPDCVLTFDDGFDNINWVCNMELIVGFEPNPCPIVDGMKNVAWYLFHVLADIVSIDELVILAVVAPAPKNETTLIPKFILVELFA